MERIQDDRRNVIIHGNAEVDDLPVTGLEDLPPVASTEPFAPSNMEDPKLYPGDVIVGVNDGAIEFVELIYDKLDDGVLLVPLETGVHTLMEDQQFSARFYQTDETHIYDDVTREQPVSDVEFDESQVERPETSRAR
jgi:hypothetical protein